MDWLEEYRGPKTWVRQVSGLARQVASRGRGQNRGDYKECCLSVLQPQLSLLFTGRSNFTQKPYFSMLSALNHNLVSRSNHNISLRAGHRPEIPDRPSASIHTALGLTGPAEV